VGSDDDYRDRLYNKIQLHQQTVRTSLERVIINLRNRGDNHDLSKAEEPEISRFIEIHKKLEKVPFGTDEHRDGLKELRPLLESHYEKNTHHPEHFENGVNGMSLLDLIEMLADWVSAASSQQEGNILKSMEYNKKRFDIDEQLYQILLNTLKEMEWVNK
jgi:hypothetical protein